MTDDGYIKLYRKIQDHWIWQNSDYFKWWMDLILLANYKPKVVVLDGDFVTIETGEHHTSESKLASRWSVSRKTVDNFLKLLTKDRMITLSKSRQNGTTVKILNYRTYQVVFDGAENNERTTKEHQKNNEGTSKEHQKNINNKENKEIKEINKDLKDLKEWGANAPELTDDSTKAKPVSGRRGTLTRPDFIPPTLEEVCAYVKERGSSVDPKRFWEYFDASAWVDSRGHPVRNWKQKFITWEGHNNGDGSSGSPVGGLSGRTGKGDSGPSKSSEYKLDVMRV